MANKAILLSMLMIFVVIGEIRAESSNCPIYNDKAVIEKLVHSNKALSEADEMLNNAYKADLRTYPYEDELKSNQDHWIRYERYDCDDWCTNVRCLLKLYQERLSLIREQYSTYFYGGDELTGEYRNADGVVSVLLMPGKKLKLYIDMPRIPRGPCIYGEHGDAIATLVDKHHAFFLDKHSFNVDECLVILKFDKNKVTLDSISNCIGMCPLNGDFFKKSKKPFFGDKRE